MKYNREQEILNRLKISGKMELGEVMEIFHVSESTARRIFTKMEQAGSVIRTHGGISLLNGNPGEYSFEKLSKAYIEEKNAIAAKACDLLSSGDILFCDTGTTILCFCIELSKRILRKQLKVDVFTNSLANLEVLSSCMNVTLVGGNYRENRKDFSGYLTEAMLEKLHFDKCFLGADGCDLNGYFTTTDFETARMDETAIRNSKKTIILCDSSKFLSSSQVGYAAFRAVDTVVTDRHISTKVRKTLEGSGIKVCCAAASQTGKE